MADTQKAQITNNPAAYFALAAVFAACGVVFLVTNLGPTWIPFLVLGITFLVIAISQTRKGASKP
ncbi:hypothetical protein BH11ACT3_BH11ACT3_22890 [soil metagenome]